MDAQQIQQLAIERARLVLSQARMNGESDHECIEISVNTAIYLLTSILKEVGLDDEKEMWKRWDSIVSYIDYELDNRDF